MQKVDPPAESSKSSCSAFAALRTALLPLLTPDSPFGSSAPSALPEDLFLGISFFQYQVAYWKGGTEMDFGIFGLGFLSQKRVPEPRVASPV